MTPVQQRVLGYDARLAWTTGVPLWLEQRRREYLLRPDVVQPLSTDTTVWPSVFAEGGGAETKAESEVQRPPWTGPIQWLWDDLGRLNAALAAAWGRNRRPCRVIAVTLMYGRYGETERERWDKRIVGIAPGVVSREWDFLGYDVSDEWLLSGLSNCGYGQEADALRREWAPYLNDHHLFADVDRAVEFQAMTDKRVEEHAPFFVYGIYSIPTDAAEVKS